LRGRKRDRPEAWAEPVERSGNWKTHSVVQERTLDLLKPRLERVKKVLLKPYQQWLSEDDCAVLAYGK
jgi:hypothetical protein